MITTVEDPDRTARSELGNAVTPPVTWNLVAVRAGAFGHNLPDDQRWTR